METINIKKQKKVNFPVLFSAPLLMYSTLVPQPGIRRPEDDATESFIVASEAYPMTGSSVLRGGLYNETMVPDFGIAQHALVHSRFDRMIKQFSSALMTFNEDDSVGEFEELVHQNEDGFDFDDFIEYAFKEASVSFRSLFLDALFQSDVDLFVLRYKKALLASKQSSSISLKQLATEIYECYQKEFDVI